MKPDAVTLKPRGKVRMLCYFYLQQCMRLVTSSCVGYDQGWRRLFRSYIIQNQ